MRYPVVFVNRQLSEWTEFLARSELPSAADFGALPLDGRGCWIVRTYVELRRRGHEVSISDQFPADRIAIVHYDDIAFAGNAARDSYVVAVRADRPRLMQCEHQLVQSPACVQGAMDHFVPLWSQAGMLPRESDRGDRVENIGFFGLPRNLADRFQSPDFLGRLQENGFRLIIREHSWNDYRDIDVVLAVRDGSPEFLAAKPASKLINAWMAGCPALVGHEPAIQTLRQSDHDFITVSSTDDVLSALLQLRADSDRYQAMVAGGRVRAAEFSDDAVVRHWEQLIDGPIARGYESWMKGPEWYRSGVRSVNFWIRRVKRRLLHRPMVRGTGDQDGQSAHPVN